MATMFDVLVAAAQRLPGTVRGVASGGGWDDDAEQVYLEDALLLTQYADDAWIGATVLLESGRLQGAVLPVTDSVMETGRLLLSGLLWQTTENGPTVRSRYTLVPGVFPVGQLEAAADETLLAWGAIETEVTLGTGDGNETTFSLPAGTTGHVVRVFQVTEDGDEFEEITHWEETSSGVECELAPFNGWAVRAVVVGWASLTDNPDWETAAVVAADTDAGLSYADLRDRGTAMAQTFTLSARARLTELSAHIANSGEATAELEFAVYGTDSDDEPDVDDMLSDVFTVDVAPTVGEWVEVEVEDVTLEPGVYAMLVRVSADYVPEEGGGPVWNFGADETYEDGAAYEVTMSDGSVAAADAEDFRFSVTGEAEIPRAGAEEWPDAIPVEWAAWYVAYVLIRSRVGIPGQDHDPMVQLMNYALERAQGERMQRGDVGVRARERLARW